MWLGPDKEKCLIHMKRSNVFLYLCYITNNSMLGHMEKFRDKEIFLELLEIDITKQS